MIFDYLRLPRRDAITVERAAPETLGLGDSADITYTHSLGLVVAGARDTVRSRAGGIVGRDGHRRTRCSAARRTRVRDDASPARRADATRSARSRCGSRRRSDCWRESSSRRRRKTKRSPSCRRSPTCAGSGLLALQNRLSEAGVRALKLRGEGTAFAGLRDYVPGDDPRLLDWKATARHGQLISREQTIERSQTVISLIDCGRAMTQLAGHYSAFEHVLSAALVLSDVAATSGDRVGLLAFDDQIRASVPPQRGDRALRATAPRLSGLEATLTEPDYASAFRVLAISQRRRALVVFFTDVVDVRSAKSFIAYAGRAAQRHLLVVVAIQNEALMAAARPSTDGATALYRSAAAEELVRERDEALARMRGAGLVVLDVAPSRMAAAVVNRYLEIKARGQL